MTPFPLSDGLGVWTGYLLYLMIGVSFGAVLEMAGFANSPKLAAQFYLKDMTVLKVMFTGVITAMVLIFFGQPGWKCSISKKCGSIPLICGRELSAD
ncbi:MAG: hypothetical protein R3C26_21810 [Calditrichia bacterium]